MSTPTDLSPTEPPPSGRNGCLTALMVVAGIVMLLPGLCSLLFGGAMLTGGDRIDGSILMIFMVTLGIALIGILLIRAALRSPRS
jgi:hypothetical protein